MIFDDILIEWIQIRAKQGLLLLWPVPTHVVFCQELLETYTFILLDNIRKRSVGLYHNFPYFSYVNQLKKS